MNRVMDASSNATPPTLPPPPASRCTRAHAASSPPPAFAAWSTSVRYMVRVPMAHRSMSHAPSSGTPMDASARSGAEACGATEWMAGISTRTPYLLRFSTSSLAFVAKKMMNTRLMKPLISGRSASSPERSDGCATRCIGREAGKRNGSSCFFMTFFATSAVATAAPLRCRSPSDWLTAAGSGSSRTLCRPLSRADAARSAWIHSSASCCSPQLTRSSAPLPGPRADSSVP
mmetsp:Transcript_34996/g.85058  ORF Transcript_34996/g.85058 Transcript_34996/m.85058 type:complete len:231 (-) Transcript_34996:656-1348(-)